MPNTSARRWLLLLLCAALQLVPFSNLTAQSLSQQDMTAKLVPRFAANSSGLELSRRTQAGTFYDVVGRRAAAYGYEHRGMEAWVHPLKIVDDFRLAFKIEGYALEFPATEIATHINVRPEATTFTYSHAAFTVRQTIFAPVDEPGIVMLLDVDSVLPMTIRGSFRPRLRLSWPGGLMTGNLEWNEKETVYYLTEETQRFVGIVGSPGARDMSVQPYQEEPRDVPAQFEIAVSAQASGKQFIPVVIAGSTEGRIAAKRNYERLLNSVEPLYRSNVEHYARVQRETVRIETPDKRFDETFAWAKIGMDKGFATNPMLGTGLVAGFRTSGESERPGFAWFFGRDALWTSLALTSEGDFAGTRTALDFLTKYQRADGKIPHEISQSASLLKWFTDYTYPWASADATPLYCIVHGDLYRASGDRAYLAANWEQIKRAYRFTAATDTDANGLIENTKFGHGWVEGGALYPAHEEIYMQGLWVETSRVVAELAGVMNDVNLAREARAGAERTRLATEKTYWLQDQNHYAFATQIPRTTPAVAEPGPYRERRQTRLNELQSKQLINEDTVLPAVPLWWKTLDADHAQTQIDHLGSARLATDWGARIISNESDLYDPLSYHYGSVWGLFTGWTSVAAYAHGRPHVGHQALMANALLTYPHALGYVTELLSGDFNAPFGRSSHHQVWSEAMVVSPTLRGMFGIAATDGGRTLRFAPQLPADWNRATVRNVAVGSEHYDFAIERGGGRQTINVTRSATSASTTGTTSGAPPSIVKLSKLVVAPSFPLDARVRGVSVNNRTARFEVTREGDVQRAVITLEDPAPTAQIVITYDEGTDVYIEPQTLVAGETSQGLRIIRSRADADFLRLTLEGRGGRAYTLGVVTPHALGETPDVQRKNSGGGRAQLIVSFQGALGAYVRRELNIPLRRTALN